MFWRICKQSFRQWTAIRGSWRRSKERTISKLWSISPFWREVNSGIVWNYKVFKGNQDLELLECHPDAPGNVPKEDSSVIVVHQTGWVSHFIVFFLNQQEYGHFVCRGCLRSRSEGGTIPEFWSTRHVWYQTTQFLETNKNIENLSVAGVLATI